MARKVILITDPGIDGAFAVSLALLDPNLEVLALVATAGNVPADLATRNVHILIEQIDPARWPRLGAALPVTYPVDGLALHGPGGLGGVDFPCAQLHHPHAGDKLLSDTLRQYPKEVTVVVMGPPTVFARALDRDPDLPALVERVVVLGGTWHESGSVNASAVADFHFFCDPAAARQLLHCGAPLTLLPLDVSRKIVFSPSDLLQLPAPESPTSRFLRQIVPYGIGATSSLFGVEGLFLKDVLGVIAVTLPSAVTTRTVAVDVETRGELTRGMSVFDARWSCTAKPNADVGVGIDVQAVRDYINRTLRQPE
jgi:inosine-uridine nucleoside N-ribohydrolase